MRLDHCFGIVRWPGERWFLGAVQRPECFLFLGSASRLESQAAHAERQCSPPMASPKCGPAGKFGPELVLLRAARRFRRLAFSSMRFSYLSIWVFGSRFQQLISADGD